MRRSLLDSGEQAKAKRFRRELDRRHYVVSHGKLRLILAAYLPLPPKVIDLAAQTCSKPYIVGDQRAEPVFIVADRPRRAGVLEIAGSGIGERVERDFDFSGPVSADDY